LTAAQGHTEARPTKAFAAAVHGWFKKLTDEHAWVHLSFWQIRPITAACGVNCTVFHLLKSRERWAGDTTQRQQCII